MGRGGVGRAAEGGAPPWGFSLERTWPCPVAGPRAPGHRPESLSAKGRGHGGASERLRPGLSPPPAGAHSGALPRPLAVALPCEPLCEPPGPRHLPAQPGPAQLRGWGRAGCQVSARRGQKCPLTPRKQAPWGGPVSSSSAGRHLLEPMRDPRPIPTRPPPLLRTCRERRKRPSSVPWPGGRQPSLHCSRGRRRSLSLTPQGGGGRWGCAGTCGLSRGTQGPP